MSAKLFASKEGSSSLFIVKKGNIVHDRSIDSRQRFHISFSWPTRTLWLAGANVALCNAGESVLFAHVCLSLLHCRSHGYVCGWLLLFLVLLRRNSLSRWASISVLARPHPRFEGSNRMEVKASLVPLFSEKKNKEPIVRWQPNSTKLQRASRGMEKGRGAHQKGNRRRTVDERFTED